MSSAPSLLDLIFWICELNSGKNWSTLVLFQLRSSVRRSETLRSRADSWIGPIGLVRVLREIHKSFQTFVFWPFQMAFPKFSWSKSLPWRILLHPCEQTAGSWTSRKLFLWQYLPVRTRASKQLGEVRILQTTFASNAWLNSWISLSPSPPDALGYVSLSQATQHIFSCLLSCPTRIE